MRRLLVAGLCLVLGVGVAWGQGVTTGGITGTVVDPNGDPLPGATVLALMINTGTRYNAITDGQGRFTIVNVKAGGPYRITAQLQGFQQQETTDIYVRLSEMTSIDFQLQLEAVTGEVVVVGEANPLINSGRTGATSSVPQSLVENLPTVGRGLDDFARTNPYIVALPDQDEATTITVAGRNNRYNNIQIDGAVNNDLFGLASTGTPGGQTETTPVSLDAIQEIQLLIAPFDVRHGGFSGGGINAITRSGTNNFRGSVYGFYYDDSLVGDGPDDFPELGTFEEQQYGFRFGGPISRDKVFFFVNAELSRVDRPTGWSISGDAGQVFGGGDLVDEANEFRSILENQYGFDPGGLDQVTRNTDSDKIFARLDFNLSDSHQLTLRHNYVDAENLILRPDSFYYEFPSHAYLISDETNSTVAQLNSVFGADMFNEARITYQSIKDRRGAPPGFQAFPYVRVDGLPGGRHFIAGTERFSTANELDQDILEITDDLTFFVGNHEIVLGTHNEIFSFRNLFIQENFGAYRFDDLDALEAGVAYRFDYTYSNDATPADEFDVYQLGFYVGDTWRAQDNLSVVLGLRVDIPYMPDEPERNPLTEDIFGVSTSNVPDGNALWSPRVGFNWDLTGEGEQQLRGGIGLFSGRTPYVWISNNYARNGIEQTTLRAFGDIPFNPDPFNQPTSIGGASTQEVNLVDPEFEFPQVWRYNLAYDQQLPWWDLVATAEVLHTEVETDIKYQNLNLVPTGETRPDGRPILEELSDTFSGAYYLTNTDQGTSTNYTFKLERPYREGVWGFLAYTYGDSEVITEGTSSRAISNWQYNEAPNPNDPILSASDFEVRHRITASLSYELFAQTEWSTTISAFYNHQSGRPYTAIFGYDFPSVNNDNFPLNDPIYVPSGADDVIIENGTWAELEAWLEANELTRFAGGIAPRNATRGPWTHTLDLHVSQSIPMPYGDLEVTADILNLTNLFDSDSGHVRFVNFGTVEPVEFVGVEDGTYVYRLNDIVTDPDETIYETDNLRSRWRAKLGVRYSF